MPTPPQGSQSQPPESDGEPMDHCLNCTATYKDTPENRPQHQAPCTRCGSDGHSACQH